MPNLDHVKPGDVLVRVPLYEGQHNSTEKAEETVVHRVGPTYIQIPRIHGKPELGVDKYRRKDGVIHDGVGHVYLLTTEEYASQRLREQLEKDLRGRGIELHPGKTFDTTTLQRIVKALEPPRLLDCGLCFEENGEEVHPHPECPVGTQEPRARVDRERKEEFEAAWNAYFAANPEVQASWRHQNGYWPPGHAATS
ncbi:hypothetical protein [Streptomyces sp. NPDC088727]|uniref:beta barrel domain-containing protein n=1 Tax=Streptomyces sp. NPDC088727 TaxID=3365875 RepID=UPI00380E5F47